MPRLASVITTPESAVTHIGTHSKHNQFFVLRFDFSSSTSSFLVNTTFINSLTPLPSRIKQGDAQNLRLSLPTHAPAAYAVTSQTLSVLTPSGANLADYSRVKPFNLRRGSLEYGPFTSVGAFSVSEELHVLFESVKALPRATRLLREVEVSHWGNVAYEEHWWLLNGAAALTGGFSRLDFMRAQHLRQPTGSIDTVTFVLPNSANGMYFRDSIGNVSTSAILSHEGSLLLTLQPRFPLLGGWRIDFLYGYNLPLDEVVALQADGKYALALTPITQVMMDVAVEELELRIVLPEGVWDVEVQSTGVFDAPEWEVRPTYLDVTGRTVAVLKAQRPLVAEMNRPFIVTYRFSSVSMLQEPLLLVFGFFAVIVGAIFVSSLFPESRKRSKID